jgi:mannose-1-phosphate guanylyltransferase
MHEARGIGLYGKARGREPLDIRVDERHRTGRIAARKQLPKKACPQREKETLRRVYQTIPSISIDYGVMEKADNILLIEGDFGWSDMGSWDALWEVSDKDENGNAANCRDFFVGVDAKNSLIHSSRKLVALLGVEDLIVVDTEDSLLICKRGSSQDVKKVVEILEDKKKKEYL